MNRIRSATKKRSKQHINVFTRVRPLNAAEHAANSFTVVEIPSAREVLVKDKPHDKFSKKFTFDRVFDDHSKQIEVYNVVVKPLVEQVLAGYNCTVFAYGQTGTGKTFTMEGAMDDPCQPWHSDNKAGLIPRAAAHLFDELCVLQLQEYVVRVSFLEIYNEELIDLLSSSYDTSKIRLYEDPNKKGSIIVHGLEEVIVRSKAEVYQILQKGSEKRQTAATLMNANSSRSHTVFSINVHIKENTVDGEEVLKVGKINLVDLAGSENVTRSGSSDRRAREAGNINQSLLTLGRVIIALVERAPHIPYRESKLTRLLQESLGGRTKTSIIATISPDSTNLEETLSTLDYAHRAKNITNRPETNQKLFKKTLLLEYTGEILRLKNDLQATRERIGVYVAQENYNEMQNVMQFQAKEIEQKINRLKELQSEVENKEKILDELARQREEQRVQLEREKAELEAVVNTIKQKASSIQTVMKERKEHEHLLEKHVATEQVLLTQADQLLTVADTAATDISRLQEKLGRKIDVEQRNAAACQNFKKNFAKNGENVQHGISEGIEDFRQFTESIVKEINEETNSCLEDINGAIDYISKALVQSHEEGFNVLNTTISSTHAKCQEWVGKHEKDLANLTEKERDQLTSISTKTAKQLQELLECELKKGLETLNEAVLAYFNDLVAFVARAISDILNSHSEDRERAINFFEEMKEIVERMKQREKETAEKQEEFSKMINDTVNCFNALHTNNKEYCDTAFNTLDGINKVSYDIQCRETMAHNLGIETNTGLQQKMLEDISSARSYTSGELEKCRMLADERVSIMNKLQQDVEDLSVNLQSKQNSIEDSMAGFREQLGESNNVLMKVLTDAHGIVNNAAVDHSNLIQTYRTESVKKSEDIINDFRDKSTDATCTTNEISEKVNILLDGVHRFFTEDLQQDIPTGSTPIKKNYTYPQEFPVPPPLRKLH